MNKETPIIVIDENRFRVKDDIPKSKVVDPNSIDDESELVDKLNEYDDSYIALAIHLGLTVEELDDISDCKHGYGNCSLDYQGTYYYCGTEEEIDIAHTESLENYVDECVLLEIPKHYRNYFDTEKFIEDAKVDGFGHALNSYDGNEYEETVNNVTYFICQM